jgi:fluoride exporter
MHAATDKSSTSPPIVDARFRFGRAFESHEGWESGRKNRHEGLRRRRLYNHPWYQFVCQRRGQRIVMTYFWVAVGGAIGSIARFWCSGAVANAIGQTFPWGTLAVNIIGSFIIGFVATLTGPDGRLLVPSDARVFVMVGICGGFTTFSSFSLQTLDLIRDQEWAQAGANAALSFVLCMISVWAGYIAAASLNQVR